VRTSLGPKGMDKMVVSKTGEVIITNDGATILARMEVAHPAAKMLVDLAKSQDTEAGDGTTSVTVICGAILEAAQRLLEKGIHPTVISDAFLVAEKKAEEYIEAISVPVNLLDRDELIKVASTSLNSKVVSQNAAVLAPIAVDAMMRIIDPATAKNVDLRDVAIVKKLGGTIDDTELIDGLVFTQRAVKVAGGPTRIKDAKIGLIQFCLSPPKTDIEQSVVVSDYAQMDRILKEERKYMLDMCKQIAKTGCNVLLVQKSILRDAVTDLSLHFLAKLKILVVTDIERDDVEFICKTVGCHPVASIESFNAEKLGRADHVGEEATPDSKIVRVTGVPNPGKTVTIFVRASNRMVLDEADRSIHDALCVLRCLVKKRLLTPGGGAPEAEASYQLAHYANSLSGTQAYCVKQFSQALEVRTAPTALPPPTARALRLTALALHRARPSPRSPSRTPASPSPPQVVPYTLAENAGLSAINMVTELRNRHAAGETSAGINVRKGAITNILEENVVVPCLVYTSAISLATECVRMILKIGTRRRGAVRRRRACGRARACDASDALLCSLRAVPSSARARPLGCAQTTLS
jgi:T-complex protein 1 subunit delta